MHTSSSACRAICHCHCVLSIINEAPSGCSTVVAPGRSIRSALEHVLHWHNVPLVPPFSSRTIYF